MFFLLLGWNCQFLDNDGHDILVNGVASNQPKSIIFEENVWISSNNLLLKGTKISSNSVVAARSVVNKEFLEKNVLIAGTPAKIIKTNVAWKY